MAQCLIVADDLTGANATGVLLQKINYRSYTVLDSENFENQIPADACDCIICPTDSRAAASEVAYEAVYLSVLTLRTKETKVFGKRIDSTLRGNLGTETDAMLDALNGGYTALVVPAFPDSGRIVCGGYLLVNTVPLHKTGAALDPKNPVRTSNVMELFRKQTKNKTAQLDLEDIQQGKEHLKKSILKFSRQGIKIIIFDCVSNEDVDLIADAALASGIPFVSVDPGPFTAAVIRKSIIPHQEKMNRKILSVVGSVNPVAKVQLDEFLLSQDVFSVPVDTEKLIMSDEDRKFEIERVVSAFRTAPAGCRLYCVYGSGIIPEKRVDFSRYTEKFNCSNEAISTVITTSFATITTGILRQNTGIKGLYTSGGDITVAVTKGLKASGIRLIGEVLPLAAYGELIGGENDGIKLVTKGGMAGDRNAMKDCIQYMKERMLL
ncbi:MAG: four-carbon acid sugar kinase family protein [Treponema sp.]|jgi:uncharacterized protein YgbK (DUF1537 family)|nr:four-carbon acid sugar kinase family protein [Treponema sp.]